MVGFAANRLRRAPRSTGNAPGNLLPILVAISTPDATRDEGTACTFHITLDRQGNVPVPFSLAIRFMTAAELSGTTMEASDFTEPSLQDALITSAAAATGVTVTGFAPNLVLSFATTFVSPFVITRNTLDNPEQQGTKKTGLLISAVDQGSTVFPGTITTASVSITVADLTGVATVPTNITVPLLSDSTPAISTAITGSDGTWANAPTSFTRQWQRRWNFGDAIVDLDFANTRFVHDGTEYASIAAMVTAGFYDEDAITTNVDTVDLTGLMPAAYTIYFEGVTAAALLSDEMQAPLALDDSGATWNDEIVYFDRTGTPHIRCSVYDASVFQGVMFTGSSVANSTAIKMVARIQVNACGFCVNGGSVLADNTVTVPTVTRLCIGGMPDTGGSYGFRLWDGTVTRIAILDRIPTNAELAALVAPVGGGDIGGATGADYTPTPADSARNLRVGNIAHNAAGPSTVAYSAWSEAVADAPVTTPVPALISAPVISDTTPQVGVATSCSTGVWSNNPTSFAYQWQKVTTNIGGATSSPYTPVGGDQGSTLRCLVTPSNAAGAGTAAASASTSAVGAAPSGVLTNVTLSTDLLPWSMTSIENTAIATFVPQGGTIATAVIPSGGDAGGKVKISGGALVAGPTAPTFGHHDLDRQVSPAWPHYSESVTVNFTGTGGGAFSRQYPLRAQFPKIDPTGGAGGTPVSVNSLATLRAELENPTTDARIIRFDTSTFTTIETNSSTPMAIINGKENFTFVGHRRVIFGRDCSLNIQYAKNYIFINCAFRPGADVAGQSRQNRDGLIVRSGSDGKFAYCDISWTIDEILSVIFDNASPIPRRTLFYRCAFYEPLRNAGHSVGEPNHPYGPMSYEGTQQSWFIECTFMNFNKRNPALGTKASGVVQNCFVGRYASGSGTGGTGVGSSSGSQENAPSNRTGYIIQGNLYYPSDQTADTRSRAILFFNIGSGGYIYIAPTSSAHANYLIKRTSGAWDFTSDPYAPTMVKLDSSTLASLVSTLPFEFLGFTPRATNSVATRQALFELLLGEDDCVVGVRTFGGGSGDPLTDAPDPGWNAMSKIGHDSFENFVTTGVGRTQTGGYPPPMTTSSTYQASFDTVKDLYDTGVPS